MRVAQPRAAGQTRTHYRLARVAGGVVFGEHTRDHYDPWKGREGLKGGVENPIILTNRGLAIAFGSSELGPTGSKRTVRLLEVSNDRVAPGEFGEYALRLRRQRDLPSGDALTDRLPSLGEALAKAAAVKKLESTATFGPDAIARRLAETDRWLDHKDGLRRVANLTRLRDLAQIDLDKWTRELHAAQARGDGDAAGRARANVGHYERRLAAVAGEEDRRRAKTRAAEARLAAEGRGVSVLTSRLNAKTAESNRAMMEKISDDLRGKSTAQLEADIEDNPYQRRRTIPQNLWSVPGQQAAAAAAGKAAPAPAAAAAGASSSSSSGAAAGHHASVSAEDALVTTEDLFGEGPDSEQGQAAGAAAGGDAATSAVTAGLGGLELLSPSASVSTGPEASPAASSGAGGRKSISLADFRKRLQASSSSSA